ncbi:MAG: type I restriction endonuclease subunit R [Flavobacteriales bacterium]|nr:type I restriction endonuclease subunit R [Flavobacteriales bacterium]
MTHNEDSRVKIPGILHLMKLGYEYLSLKDERAGYDEPTNIFTDIFLSAMSRINENFTVDQANKLLDEIRLELDYEDLGKAFYQRLVDRSGIRLIDFEHPENNSYHVVTELTCKNGEDEFRPDITLLINGLPLVFVEVKKPNNLDGVQAERNRMEKRLQNKKFRRFINATQLMIFSNNMEYEDGAAEPLAGAFYASTSYHKPVFNYFREEEELQLTYQNVSDAEEDFVLKDNNLTVIKKQAEFQTNKATNTPTHRIFDSLLSRERLLFFLEFALAYVDETSGLQKHIMRYPQLFATKAIAKTLDQGINKGIIWHTQGSGKTALTYYNVKHLTHYYQQKKVVPKFYFIVDRLDLLTQAKREFTARGLKVHVINSKEEFARDIKAQTAVHNDRGQHEITVVNIHKFKDDPSVAVGSGYNLELQRVYFMDEVHRSYNPKGSFLANLMQSDPNAIKIGLTGTPLIISQNDRDKVLSGESDKYDSKALFGDYIHKYYYNKSIADGYTLRLIREEIETSTKMELNKILEEIKVKQGDADKTYVYAHRRFVEPMLDYIISDFEMGRITHNDDSIGAMVICDSSDQAKMMMEVFAQKYAEVENGVMYDAAEPQAAYGKLETNHRKIKSAGLILHDVQDKETRKDVVEDFKAGKIDILFVYQMLLTGFDAKRLKKLYIGRKIAAHNLLQALTRVNRTYKDFRYGYVVDFADIESEFDKTNKAYFDELTNELGDELEHYSNLFKTEEEIEKDITKINEVLWQFDLNNAEVFRKQIEEIKDRKEMIEIVKALNSSKSLYNLIRLSGQYDQLDKLDFRKLQLLAREAQHRLNLINAKDALENKADTTNLLNLALEDVVFAFTKVGEAELVLADELKDTLRRTREKLGGSLDPIDPQFISLKEELERLFKKKNITQVERGEMEQNMQELNRIYDLAKELDKKNARLTAKYQNDVKYMRIHKRLSEKDPLTDSELKLFEALNDLKKAIDEQILQNAHQMENETFVERMIEQLVIKELYKKHGIQLNLEKTKYIGHLVFKEYMNEYVGNIA